MTYEKSADDLEMAAHLQDQLNTAGVAAARQAMAPQKADGFDGVHCVEPDCGEPLPPVRIAYGRVRCTDCQVKADRLAKRGKL